MPSHTTTTSCNSNTPKEFWQQLTARNHGTISAEAQQKLRHARVAIVGLGGVGGLQAEQLARHGVGSLTIIDEDTFEVSNINRQCMARTSTIGKSKALVTKEQLLTINPYLTINTINNLCTAENATELLANHDLIMQAVDCMYTRVIIHRTAEKLNIPVVTMSGSPPFRGFLALFTSQSPPYEQCLNLPSLNLPYGAKMREILINCKKNRAKYATTHGASTKWANEYNSEQAPWSITCVRASLIATLGVHAAVQLLGEGQAWAQAPDFCLIDLTKPQAVSITKPPKEGWSAEQW